MGFPMKGWLVAVKCPKCNGRAWYMVEERELWLRCLCGYMRVVYSEAMDGSYIRHVIPKKSVEIPKPGTKLFRCLWGVASVHPAEISTGDVSEAVDMLSKDAASFLMVLQHKGLVEKKTSRRGRAGGSTWVLSRLAVDKLEV